jgi:hypothetical protein
MIGGCRPYLKDDATAKPSQDRQPLQVLMPLYIYPGKVDGKHAWQPAIDAAKKVPIVVAINPNNGPNNGPPNPDYRQGIKLLKKAGIKVLGYVKTGYGKRSEPEVKADIDLYDRYFQIDGIFLDETGNTKQYLSYYNRLQKYIKTRKQLGTRITIVNPGTHIDEGFLRLPIDSILTFEDNNGKNWRDYQPRPYTRKYARHRFALLLHSVKNESQMQREIDLARQRHYGYVYITNDSMVPDGNPWDTFPSYWEQEINYIRSLKYDR